MPKYIFSTLTCDQVYSNARHNDAGGIIEDSQVFIKGGAGLANDRLITPLGVLTEVSDEDYEQLLQNEVFKIHVKNGFIKAQDKKADAEKVAADMARKDGSAPLVEQDFAETPKTGA
jgi:hypothetical protein